MNGTTPRLAFVNLGCRVNRVELDDMAYTAERLGAQIVPAEEADLVVINTCAVTGEAEAKTRKAIRKHAALPQSPLVLATGCVAALFSNELTQLGEHVLVEIDKRHVPLRAMQELGFVVDTRNLVPKEQLQSILTPTGRTRPGIKIQDGCDHRCTFCIVWKARGPGRSLPYKQVVERVQEQYDQGVKEVVLTGINLGCYHTHYNNKDCDIATLLENLLKDTDISRIRLSSIEPQDVSGHLLDVIAHSSGRIASYLHIPLQSGCDATLRRMGRAYTLDDYMATIQLAKKMLPSLSLGCDLIVGFPGETDEEFAQSMQTCKEAFFAKMHIFRYSKRPGTPAAQAPNQVDPQVMNERAKQARELAIYMRQASAASLAGKTDYVVIQGRNRGVSSGLFDVQLNSHNLHGMYNCMIDAVRGTTLLAHIIQPKA